MRLSAVQSCSVEIKRAVDRDRRPGRFLLSGSANFALLRGVAESLAGRAVYLTLHPFTRREIQGELDRRPCYDASSPRAGRPGTAGRSDWTGTRCCGEGFRPSRSVSCGHPRIWFTGYEQTYLERDVRDLSRIGDLVSFRSLLRLAALRTAQVLKISELARDAKLAAATAGRYLSLLEASFVVSRIPPFLVNEATRLIKSPKLFMSDAGLAAHLGGFSAGEPGVGTVPGGAARDLRGTEPPGAALRGMARCPPAYWHVQGRHEVDFVVESGRECLAIEVKAGARWTDRDLSGLRVFLGARPGADWDSAHTGLPPFRSATDSGRSRLLRC